MKIQIELQGCSLEIAHIGTRDEIMLATAAEAVDTFAKNMADLGRIIANVFAEIFDQIGQAFRRAGDRLRMSPK